MTYFKVSPLPLLLLLLCTPVQSQTLTGRVIGISNGDTITVLDNGKVAHKVHFYGIDSPENNQPFGQAAKRFTSRLTARKIASITVIEMDQVGRTVGIVTIDGMNMNLKLIDSGYAWQDREKCTASFCSDWLQAETIARKSGIGLWGRKDPIAPWRWHKKTEASTRQATVKKHGKAQLLSWLK